MPEILPGETVLDDDYPVHCGFSYVADGKWVESPVSGTVARLKVVLGATEIRRCELVKRMKAAKEASGV